jgi:transposase
VSSPRKYPRELKERAVRMVAEARSNYQSEHAAISAVASKLGITTPETLRGWVRRAQVDAGERPGVTTDEHDELQRLRRENAELRRANEILKAASAFMSIRRLCGAGCGRVVFGLVAGGLERRIVRHNRGVLLRSSQEFLRGASDERATAPG